MFAGRWRRQADRILPLPGISFSDFCRLLVCDPKVIFVIAGAAVVEYDGGAGGDTGS
jgi:hypothetical protein